MTAPAVDIRMVPCRSALTGEDGSYRLNPYVGCTHRCAYCYATYVAGYREITQPWGTWVLVKRDVVPLLQTELAACRGAGIFMSTTCDIYQPVEERFGLTRACLEALRHAALFDPGLRVTILTKSDRVLRDIGLLAGFPAGVVDVSFSLTTHRDEVAALVEPYASRPSARIAAAEQLVARGITTGFSLSPVLPYVGEQDLMTLVGIAARLGLAGLGFDHLNYLDRHVGPTLEPVYRQLGPAAMERLAAARTDPGYRQSVDRLIAQARRRFEAERRR
jgi:DNA repair photolyase